MQETTSPSCFTLGCEEPAALTEKTTGKFWTYITHYCARCYERMIMGDMPVLDTSRIIAIPAKHAVS